MIKLHLYHKFFSIHTAFIVLSNGDFGTPAIRIRRLCRVHAIKGQQHKRQSLVSRKNLRIYAVDDYSGKLDALTLKFSGTRNVGVTIRPLPSFLGGGFQSIQSLLRSEQNKDIFLVQNVIGLGRKPCLIWTLAFYRNDLNTVFIG